jgi:hypothetical protein
MDGFVSVFVLAGLIVTCADELKVCGLVAAVTTST